MKPMLTLMALATAALAGCASQDIQGPAKTISADVSGLSANLSTLQDDLGAYQQATQRRLEGQLIRTNLAQSASRQRQTEWRLIDADDTSAALGVLMDQARAETDRLTAPATSTPEAAKVALPVQAMAKVAKGVDGLARPKSRKDELKLLLSNLQAVNEQLAKLEKGSESDATAKPAEQ